MKKVVDEASFAFEAENGLRNDCHLSLIRGFLSEDNTW